MPSKMPTASRDRFLDTLSCRAVDRPPVWLMRQAGRFLPEYRALRERSSFLELVRTPALAAEATLQPVRRFPGIDVAILFSDILVIAEALGQPYGVRDDGGIAMGYRIETLAQIAALASADSAADHLRYVGDTLMLVRSELAGAKALLGFGGSPWTLAAYMVEGGSSTDFKRIKLLYYTDRHTFDALLRKITEALIAYFQLQIAAGADKKYDVIIAGAGKAAHLPGVIAGHTSLPVIGVPIKTSDLGGMDSLLSIVQMPKGVPVATVAINGAQNAGILAAQIVALKDPAVKKALKEFKESLKG